MKKILVPTDFSTPATYAADAAIEIAEKFHAEVHFYTRLAIPFDWDALTDKEKTEFPGAAVQYEEMKKQFKALKAQYASTRVRIITAYSHGNMIEVVGNYIDKEEIDLVVMGSSGAEGLKEWLYGSHSQKVARNAHCPVLVIKHPIEKPDFKHILFASDFSHRALKPFERLIEWANVWGAHIHLVNVAAWPKFDLTQEDYNRMEAFQKKCWAVPCSIHGQGDLNVELGITHFAMDKQADLIAIANYAEPFLKRILKGSVSEKLVNHVEIPVLVLNTAQQQSWKQESDSLREETA